MPTRFSLLAFAQLVGGLASCSLGIIVAGYASKFSGAGAIYAFVSRAASPSLGFFCGWLYFAAVFLIACGGTAFLAVLTQQFCDMAFGMSPPFILVLVLENAALAACTVLDVRQSTRTQLVVTAVSAVLVLGCCAYAAIFVRRSLSRCPLSSRPLTLAPRLCPVPEPAAARVPRSLLPAEGRGRLRLRRRPRLRPDDVRRL